MQKVSLIALVQMNASENKIENLKLSVDFIKEAAKKESKLNMLSRISNGVFTH